MSDVKHPAFPNPTVREAVCQIDFQLAQGSSWTASRPADFIGLVARDFPGITSVPQFAVMLPGAPMNALPNSGATLRLTSSDGCRYLSIGDQRFVFGTTAPYPGWETFKAQLLENWVKFSTLVAPSSIDRIGLRYMNYVPWNPATESISDWLSSTTRIPEQLIKGVQKPFLLRLESWSSDSSFMILTLAQQMIPDSHIILDLDRIEQLGSEAALEAVGDHVDLLHLDIWNEFSAAQGPRYKEFLGRPQ